MVSFTRRKPTLPVLEIPDATYTKTEEVALVANLLNLQTPGMLHDLQLLSILEQCMYWGIRLKAFHARGYIGYENNINHLTSYQAAYVCTHCPRQLAIVQCPCNCP